MEKLLLIGINTRGLVNSASKLKNYQTYSVSYFKTADFKDPYKEKHILKQIPEKTCGFFEDNYNFKELLELSKDYLEEVDKIILSTGLSTTDFKGKFKKYKKKIIGNAETEELEDKYKFYKKIKNKFLTPKTFKVKCKFSENEDLTIPDEILEIFKQYKDMSFIIKPLQGSGGYGVNLLNYNIKNKLNNITLEKIFSYYEGQEFLIQEYVEGISISSSVLSSKTQAKTIMVSRMLTEHDFGKKNSFKYCGNIVPFDYSEKKLNTNHVNNISEEIIEKFKLMGSNGIDMIIDKKSENEDPYIIEVNPRFQGTYESIEEILKINLLDAHIKACEGELIEIPKPSPNEYSIKRIIYSDKSIKVGNLKINNNVYDIPFKDVIIEKDEPLLTIITAKNSMHNAKNIMESSIRKINKNVISLDYSHKN